MWRDNGTVGARIASNRARSPFASADSAADARTLCQGRAPGAHLGRLVKDRKLDQRVEHVEIAEDRREHGIDETEVFAGEERARTQRLLDAGKFCGDRLPFALEDCRIARRLQAP